MNKKLFINILFSLIICVTSCVFFLLELPIYNDGKIFWSILGIVFILFYLSFTVIGELFLWRALYSLIIYPQNVFNLISNTVLALLSCSEIISSIYVYTVAGYNQTYVYIILAMIAVIIAYSIVVSVIRRITNRKKQNLELAIPEEQNT